MILSLPRLSMPYQKSRETRTARRRTSRIQHSTGCFTIAIQVMAWATRRTRYPHKDVKIWSARSSSPYAGKSAERSSSFFAFYTLGAKKLRFGRVNRMG